MRGLPQPSRPARSDRMRQAPLPLGATGSASHLWGATQALMLRRQVAASSDEDGAAETQAIPYCYQMSINSALYAVSRSRHPSGRQRCSFIALQTKGGWDE